MSIRDGLYNKHDMVKSIIKLLNSLTVSGSKDVVLLAEVFQMLFALQKGLKNEDEAKAETIKLLKEQLAKATEPHPEEGGDVVGGEHYDLNFGGVENGGN